MEAKIDFIMIGIATLLFTDFTHNKDNNIWTYIAQGCRIVTGIIIIYIVIKGF